MEPSQTSGPRTTSHSAQEQRLRVDAGRRRLLKKAVRKAKKK